MLPLKLLNFLAFRLPMTVFKNQFGRIYLSRFKLWGYVRGHGSKSAKWSCYLHRFSCPDSDRVVHSHPWAWSFSIILRGGYSEDRLIRPGLIRRRRLWPFMINFFGKNDFHRVTHLHGKETWTLFVGGRYTSDWGFMDPERGFVPHAVWFLERGIEERGESVNREQKEHQLQQMYKGLSFADKLIWAHAIGIHVPDTKGIDEALPLLDAEAFETFYEESMEQWNLDGSFKYNPGDPG